MGQPASVIAMLTTAISAAELGTWLGLWTTGDHTLVEDLSSALMQLIDDGVLAAGATLPPQRLFAPAIGVSRGSVAAAYAMLEGTGHIMSQQGSGSRVRSGPRQLRTHSEGRLFSFTADSSVVDLSTAALQASQVAREVIARAKRPSSDYLDTDGYFPAGLPALRQAVAQQLTADGVPTVPSKVLITAGAQEATWLVARAFVGSGDVVLLEEPTYRGAIEAIREQGTRLRGIPVSDHGILVAQAKAAMRESPSMLYVQTGVHNPTGRSMTAASRRQLAESINHHGVVTVDDRCWADLALEGPEVAGGLNSHVDPDLLITIGTASKLFWGGIRIGWIRASESRIKALQELIKTVHLGCSISDQLIAVELLPLTSVARAERRLFLRERLAVTEAELHRAFPHWTWGDIEGGSALWVDTKSDATAMVSHGKRVGVKLVGGPSFSAHDGQQTMLRMPLWHDARTLRFGLDLLAGAE